MGMVDNFEYGDDVRGCYDPVLVVPNCWELV